MLDKNRSDELDALRNKVGEATKNLEVKFWKASVSDQSELPAQSVVDAIRQLRAGPQFHAGNPLSLKAGPRL
jgi:hypothetical protein